MEPFEGVGVEGEEFALDLADDFWGCFEVAWWAEVCFGHDHVGWGGKIVFSESLGVFYEQLLDEVVGAEALFANPVEVFLGGINRFGVEVGADHVHPFDERFAEDRAAAAEWIVQRFAIEFCVFGDEGGEVDHHLCQFWWQHSFFGEAGRFFVVTEAVRCEVLNRDGLGGSHFVVDFDEVEVGAVFEKASFYDGGGVQVSLFVEEAYVSTACFHFLFDLFERFFEEEFVLRIDVESKGDLAFRFLLFELIFERSMNELADFHRASQLIEDALRIAKRLMMDDSDMSMSFDLSIKDRAQLGE